MDSPLPSPAKKQVNLSFSNLSVTVQDGVAKTTKTILHGVSGQARPGRLLALMGASGAGKTTLLDVLAGNTGSNRTLRVEGTLLLNDKPFRSRDLRGVSCYVQQRDVLLASATVREAITTSALLKLPFDMPLHEKHLRVDKVLRDLDLESCADTLIGDELLGIKGISGGQKRRVSVGIELIKDPAIIFLDEPTSGLDSEMALSCMEALVKLARMGRTVVCTIHQPNSDITALFDDFMLLASGHVVYSGPWTAAVSHFAQQGYHCPPYKNPTDYFLSVVRNPKAAEALWTARDEATKGLLATAVPAGMDDTASPRKQPLDNAALAASPPAHDVEQGLDQSTVQATDSLDPAPEGAAEGPQDLHTPCWYQVWVLCQRRVKDWLRNPTMLTSELIQYAVVALFVGLMYFGTFKDNTEDGVTNRVSCIWFAFTVMCFTPSYTATTNWEKERHLLKRELNQRAYSPTTSYVSRTLVLLPFQAVQCLLFISVMYFFAGFQHNAAKFFTFFLTLFLFQLVSEGIGLLCAVATSSATMAIVLLTLVLLMMLSFTGFLVTSIPVYFRWVNKISYFTYAYAGLVRNEFEGLTLTDASGATVPGITAVPHQSLNQFSVWQNVGILGAQVVGMELLKLAATHLSYRLGWL